MKSDKFLEILAIIYLAILCFSIFSVVYNIASLYRFRECHDSGFELYYCEKYKDY